MRVSCHPAAAFVASGGDQEHCCFFRNDRCNLTHPDLHRWVTGREHRSPERIDEVDDSERKDNARTKNHENFCGQDALPILWGPLLIPFSFARISLLLVTLRILDSNPHLLLTKSKARHEPGARRSPF